MSVVPSDHDLLYHGDEIQPLGSIKGLTNRPTTIQINMNDLFLCKKNTNRLATGLYDIYRETGKSCTYAKFHQLITLLQKKFVKENVLETYTMAEEQAIGYNDYVAALRVINDDFYKMVYNYFEWDYYNPFKHDIEVGPNDDRKLKKSAEIMPEDYGTLNVWREQITSSLNRQFRNNNKVQPWVVGIHTRHYDRSNQGLRHGDSDEASLETPIYSYDMSKPRKTVLNYKTEDWFGV